MNSTNMQNVEEYLKNKFDTIEQAAQLLSGAIGLNQDELDYLTEKRFIFSLRKIGRLWRETDAMLALDQRLIDEMHEIIPLLQIIRTYIAIEEEKWRENL